MTKTTWRRQKLPFLVFCCVIFLVDDTSAWLPQQGKVVSQQEPSSMDDDMGKSSRLLSRRDVWSKCTSSLMTTTSTTLVVGLTMMNPSPSRAYTPDSDKLRESLYLISRVQEATVQQERFVMRATLQQDLKAKLKLTLRLVEKNYRLLDQINYASGFVNPKYELVTASEAGYEAVDALQGAIDFVRDDGIWGEGPLTDGQRKFLIGSMSSCRENLFIFLKYMPEDKLLGARKRVEEENVLNREEFDGDADAGVYNPVILPWKNR